MAMIAMSPRRGKGLSACRSPGKARAAFVDFARLALRSYDDEGRLPVLAAPASRDISEEQSQTPSTWDIQDARLKPSRSWRDARLGPARSRAPERLALS